MRPQQKKNTWKHLKEHDCETLQIVMRSTTTGCTGIRLIHGGQTVNLMTLLLLHCYTGDVLSV